MRVSLLPTAEHGREHDVEENGYEGFMWMGSVKRATSLEHDCYHVESHSLGNVHRVFIDKHVRSSILFCRLD